MHWHIREDKGPEEPVQWKAERELLEHIVGVDGVEAFRSDIEARFETLVAARTVEWGAAHTGTLRIRTRHAFALYIHGKREEACEVFRELVGTYGSHGMATSPQTIQR